MTTPLMLVGAFVMGLSVALLVWWLLRAPSGDEAVTITRRERVRWRGAAGVAWMTERDLERLLDALDAADALADAEEAIASHWKSCEECQDDGCCEWIAMSDLWKNRDEALAAYRALVEGEK